MPELDIHPFNSLPLWREFEEKTKNETANRFMVLKHINKVLPLMERVIVAFPKYTLHNTRHQFNIIKIMGDLVADRISELSGLEIAILILSAVYHDIGMVYDPGDLLEIAKEPNFQLFLKNNSAARLEYEDNGQSASESLIGWYCRWMHAKRVWKFLNSTDDEIPFVWNDIPFKMQLGNICESHNEAVNYIKRNDNLFDNNFLGECDLTFCAILLRLADILDFDDTRTPLSVYEFLELEKSQKGADKISDEEWQKHMSSKGFKLESTGNRKILRFIANPEHPKIEVSIRNFLNVIESELASCNKIISLCSDRWRLFELPDEINVDGIISKNYRSGSYHFSLAEDEVMKLLTGDDIYNDDFIFLRELLQNAIDTCRHREFREQIYTTNYKSEAINVSFFTDNDGYQWIRIDDWGMGMNLEIIEKHLLKKGKSYYNSDTFKLEKLMIRQNEGVDFVPISRFGIGLLSCFIAGDKIEISTMHRDEADNAYRLSVEGRTGFFMLQTKSDHHSPSPMPAENHAETGYRNLAGTSIAVRITTNKEYDGFDMNRQLKHYLVAPPITVKYNGLPVGGDFSEMLIKPWTEPKTYEIDENYVDRVRRLTDLPFEKGIKVSLLPINLTKDSLSPNIKGQLILIYIDLPPDALSKTPKVNFRLELREKNLSIHCVKDIEIEGKNTELRETEDISFIIEKLQLPSAVTDGRHYPYNEYHLGGIQLSHNGIRIIDEEKMFLLEDDNINNYQEFGWATHNFSYICAGVIYFQDELLPDLTVSRNEIKEVRFPVIANVMTAARELNQLIYFNKQQKKYDFFKELDRDVDYAIGIMESSQFYERHKQFWDEEIIISTNEGEFSISDLIAKRPEKLLFIRPYHASPFYQNLIDYILQANFDLYIVFTKTDDGPSKLYYLGYKSSSLPEGITGFPPMTFIRFENADHLLSSGRSVNLNHPYTKWYMLAYSTLALDYHFYAKQLIYAVFQSSSYTTSRPDIEKTNRILYKLRQVLPVELRPSSEITVKISDFDLGSD